MLSIPFDCHKKFCETGVGAAIRQLSNLMKITQPTGGVA